MYFKLCCRVNFGAADMLGCVEAEAFLLPLNMNEAGKDREQKNPFLDPLALQGGVGVSGKQVISFLIAHRRSIH